MILCPLSQFHRYRQLHPRFPAVETFLRETDLGALPEGRLEVDGDALYVSAAPEARTKPAGDARLEAHRSYVDVQVILTGTDTMGWAPLEDCRRECGPYDPDKDVVFFHEAPTNLIAVPAGHLAIFFPEDAHAPLIGDGQTVKKLVVKVRL